MERVKDVNDYLPLPYTLEITPDLEDGGWVIGVSELPGCLTQADQWDDVLPRIQEAMTGWIEVSLEHGDPIPEPAGSK